MEQIADTPIDVTHRFAGDVAVVTGGSRGIGRAVVDRLSYEGAAVAILARDRARAEAVVAELVEGGSSAMAIPCDVSRRAEVQAAIDSVVDRFGTITVLVNDAGIFEAASFLDMTDETWSAILGTNLTGMFIVGQACARVMAARRAGRIVNLSSVAARIAHSDQAAYAVSKAGIEALTRAMAIELAPLGIAVNAVAPGTIQTSFAAGAMPSEAVRERIRRIPMGRLGLAEEVAAAVAFLASRDAAYITGSVVTVDGGLVPAGVRLAGT